jgi:hypothetical protein
VKVTGDEGDTDAYRLIYAESDGIPALIVDRYNDVLVLQSLTAGSEYWKETLADLLLEETGLSTIYERSDADVRELEGLEPKVGSLRGTNPQLPITITEHNLQFRQPCKLVTKPASTSTSAGTVCACANWQKTRMCWIASATRADSPSTRWQAEQSPFYRLTPPRMRWRCAKRILR